MKIKVTQELTGAWEVWEYEVPEGTDLTDLGTSGLSGEMVDSGFDSASVTGIEQA